MDSYPRKRNVSDGDSGFDSALSSRSSSISLEESAEFGKLFQEDSALLTSKLSSRLKEKFSHVLALDEDIRLDYELDSLYVIVNQVTGEETLYKPPSRLCFASGPPSQSETYCAEEYDRGHPIPRSQLFHSRVEYELEKQVANMKMVQVDLVVNNNVTPAPSLGIRVVGVNMIHGVQDKLNIYVKKVVDDSLAGSDGRIQVNDHIIEVNGISLVGVSQKLAAQTLSNCAISPETGTVHFVLARPQEKTTQGEINLNGNQCDETEAVLDKNDNKNISTSDEAAERADKLVSAGDKLFTNPTNAFVGNSAQTFEGRDAVRLRSLRRTTSVVELSRFSKQLVIFGSLLLVSIYVTAFKK